MTAPLISFCIPTFERARYLEALLGSMAEHLAAFPYPFEIVIGDNASADRTPAVVQAFAERLPIRYTRHAENIGGFANLQFVLAQAGGRYVMYVADDDSILAEHVAAVVARMEADPGIAVVYAPWIMFDLVARQHKGLFFEIPQDFHVRRGDQRTLLDCVLAHHIFPEISIVRSEVLQRVMPRVNEHAFFAFVHAADYLQQGDVLIQQQPFYASITNYFADAPRQQLGHQEVESAWDRYRGGLEYMLARVGPMTADDRTALQARIQRMIAARMSVAIRVRQSAGRNPIDTHMIAMRLRGVGYERLSPVPIQVLAGLAALYFVATDVDLQRGMQRIVCVGPLQAEQQAYLREHARLPVVFVPGLLPADAMPNTLVFALDQADLVSGFDAQRHVRVVTESDLAGHFAP